MFPRKESALLHPNNEFSRYGKDQQHLNPDSPHHGVVPGDTVLVNMLTGERTTAGIMRKQGQAIAEESMASAGRPEYERMTPQIGHPEVMASDSIAQAANAETLANDEALRAREAAVMADIQNALGATAASVSVRA